jgi:hypothetical protein
MSSRFENNCLVLLCECYKHRGERQTQEIIAEWCDISQQDVSDILLSDQNVGRDGQVSVRNYGPNGSLLAKTAACHGFRYANLILKNRPGVLIDVYDCSYHISQ